MIVWDKITVKNTNGEFTITPVTGQQAMFDSHIRAMSGYFSGSINIVGSTDVTKQTVISPGTLYVKNSNQDVLNVTPNGVSVTTFTAADINVTGSITASSSNMSIKTITANQITLTNPTPNTSAKIFNFTSSPASAAGVQLRNDNNNLSLRYDIPTTLIAPTIAGGNINNSNLSNVNLQGNTTVNGLGLTPAVAFPMVNMLIEVKRNTTDNNKYDIKFIAQPEHGTIEISKVTFGGATYNNIIITAGASGATCTVQPTLAQPEDLVIYTDNHTYTYSRTTWNTGIVFSGLEEFGVPAPFTLLCDRSDFLMAVGSQDDIAWFNQYAYGRHMTPNEASIGLYGHVFTAKTSS